MAPALEQADGALRIEREGHRRSFAPELAGLEWTVKANPRTDSSAADTPDPPLPASLAPLLTGLQVYQRDVESQAYSVEQLRQQVYALWYESHGSYPGGGPDVGLRKSHRIARYLQNDARAKLENGLRDLLDAVDVRDSALAKVRAQLRTLGSRSDGTDRYRLDAVPGAAFWRPADPSVALQFDQPLDLRKHGADRKLRCRLGGQEIRSVDVPGARRPLEGQRLLAHADVELPPELRDLVGDLWAEHLLLDPLVAGAASGQGQDFDPLAVGHTGTKPAERILYEEARWAPRFTPVAAEWRVELDSTYPGLQPGSGSFNPLADWEADGTDYRWPSENWTANDSNRMALIGRNPLSPRPAASLVAQLRRWVDDQPNTPDHQTLRGQVDELERRSLMTVNLGGFHDHLLDRVRAPQLPLLDKSLLPGQTPAPGAEARQKLLRELVADQNTFRPSGQVQWFPIRSGALKGLEVWIIDAFGRQIRATVDDLKPAISGPLRKAGPASALAMLAPRVVEPTRVVLHWCDARDPGVQPSTLVPATSPVCGWVLPNHLEGSLQVYDADGRPLGNVETDYRSWRTRWTPFPGQPLSVLDDLGPHLGALVRALLDGRLRFTSFLNDVDETLSTVQPLGARADGLTSVLIGRPLAVLRASVSIEVLGELPLRLRAVDLRSREPLGPPAEANALQDVRIPVALGAEEHLEDGLVRYFVDDDYSNARGPGDSHLSLPIRPSRDPSPTPLTLLMDPRAGVHVHSGLLPTGLWSCPAPTSTKL